MNIDFNCPHCLENNIFEFYPEDGLHQDTILDCEVCCRPIELKVDFTYRDNPTVIPKASQ